VTDLEAFTLYMLEVKRQLMWLLSNRPSSIESLWLLWTSVRNMRSAAKEQGSPVAGGLWDMISPQGGDKKKKKKKNFDQGVTFEDDQPKEGKSSELDAEEAERKYQLGALILESLAGKTTILKAEHMGPLEDSLPLFRQGSDWVLLYRCVRVV
jgi:hypothetical protein